MCSGKSTLARSYAIKEKTFFIDTDNLISYYEQKDIPDIFKYYSQTYFRLKEKQCAEWIKSCVRNTVIATGGGFPIYYQEVQSLGKVVFLDIDFELIIKRITAKAKSAKQRPLYKNKDELFALYQERLPIYKERADIVIDANNHVNKILNQLKVL